MYPLRTKFFSRDKKNLKRSPDGRATTKWRIFLKFLLSDFGNVKIVHFFSFELFYCYKIFKFFVWKLFNAWGLKFPHFFNWWYWDCQNLFYINFQQKELFISKQLARKKALKAHIHPPWYLSFFWVSLVNLFFVNGWKRMMNVLYKFTYLFYVAGNVYEKVTISIKDVASTWFYCHNIRIQSHIQFIKKLI